MDNLFQFLFSLGLVLYSHCYGPIPQSSDNTPLPPTDTNLLTYSSVNDYGLVTSSVSPIAETLLSSTEAPINGARYWWQNVESPFLAPSGEPSVEIHVPSDSSTSTSKDTFSNGITEVRYQSNPFLSGLFNNKYQPSGFGSDYSPTSTASTITGDGSNSLGVSPGPSSTLAPFYPSTTYKGPLANPAPYPGCSAALKCVPENYCSADGVASDRSFDMTPDFLNARVPLTECSDPASGLIGKCCRDPNYKDPWPVDLLHEHHHPEHEHPDSKVIPTEVIIKPTSGYPLQPSTYNLVSISSFKPSTGQNPANEYGASIGPIQGYPKLTSQALYIPPQQPPQSTHPKPTYIPPQLPTYFPPSNPSCQPQEVLSQQPLLPPYVSGPQQPGYPVQPEHYPSQPPSLPPLFPSQSPQFPSLEPQYPSQPLSPASLLPQPPSLPPQYPSQPSLPPQLPSFSPQYPTLPPPSHESPSYPTPSNPNYSPTASPPLQYPTSTPSSIVYPPSSIPTQPSYQPSVPSQFLYPSFPTQIPNQPVLPQVPSQQPSFPPQYQISIKPQAPSYYPVQSELTVPSSQRPYSSEQSKTEVTAVKENSAVCGVKKNDGTAYGDAPWHAIVYSNRNKDLICGGAIVSENAVLTTAHCLDHSDSDSTEVKIGPEGKVYKAAAITRHSKYDSISFSRDLALVFLREPIQFSEYVEKICLPTSFTQLKSYNRDCYVSTLAKEFESLTLQTVPVELFPYKDCEIKLRNTYLGKYFVLNDSFSCVSTPSDQELCSVKTGSPIVCNKGDGTYDLFGIKSWDLGCQQYKSSAIFSNYDVIWVQNALAAPIEQLVAEEKTREKEKFKGESLEGININEKPAFNLGYGK